jgi:hypothetical protein
MTMLYRISVYLLAIIIVVLIHALFFVHHPPEVQLAFLSPGVTLLAYSIIRDDFYVKPHHTRLLKKNNIFN